MGGWGAGVYACQCVCVVALRQAVTCPPINCLSWSNIDAMQYASSVCARIFGVQVLQHAYLEKKAEKKGAF